MKSRLKSILPIAILGLMLIAVSVWGYFICKRHDVVTSFDQAEMALVARNLLRGEGYTTDAIWLWVRDWGSAHHPENVWPLLQPTLTAASFLLFGEGAAAQKAVGIFFLLALMVTTFIVAKSLFGPATGIIAAMLILPNNLVLSVTVWGLNDVGAAFFYLAAIYVAYLSFDKSSSNRHVALAALFTGLAILQKFQGVLLVIAYGLWQAGGLRRDVKNTITRSALFLLVLMAVGTPLMLRNLSNFKQISYPANEILLPLGAAWNPTVQTWRGQMVYYKLYWEHERPTYGKLLKHRGAKYVLFWRPLNEFKRFLSLLAKGLIVERPLLILGLLGVILVWGIEPKWVKWNGVVFLSSLSFIAFRNIQERYYIFLVPMMAVFAARLLLWCWHKLESKHTVFAVSFAVLCLPALTYPAYNHYQNSEFQSERFEDYQYRLALMLDWFKKNLKPGEGVMSYHAAEIAFEADTTAARIPNTDLARLIQLADQYKLRYLALNYAPQYLRFFKQPGTQHWVQRQLAPLFAGHEIYGFKLEYKYKNLLFIYRIPRPDEVDLNTLPRLPKEPDDFTILLLPPHRGGLDKAPPPLNLRGKQRF